MNDVFAALARPILNRPGDPVKDPNAVRKGHAAAARMKERKFPVVSNPWGLTGAEWAVLQAMLGGAGSAETARALFMSPKTLATHMTRLREKMGAKTTLHAVLILDRWMRAPKVDVELYVRFVDGVPTIEMRTPGTPESSVEVEPSVRPQECAANGEGHHDGPYGPQGQRQCYYCGQRP